MGSLAAKSGVREVKMELTVLGPCRYCNRGASEWPTTRCTGPKHESTFTKPLGVVSSWHKNPLIRAWRKLRGR